MGSLTDEMMGWVIAGMAAMIVVLLFWTLRTSRKLGRLSRQYRAMMDGAGVDNLEQLLRDLQQRMRGQEEAASGHAVEMKRLQDAYKRMKGKIGILRYNAFEGQGSDLSFSVAIVNEASDGIVLSGIHSREETYVYVKPVDNGQSKYPLTPEEQKAISLAAQQK